MPAAARNVHQHAPRLRLVVAVAKDDVAAAIVPVLCACALHAPQDVQQAMHHLLSGDSLLWVQLHTVAHYIGEAKMVVDGSKSVEARDELSWWEVVVLQARAGARAGVLQGLPPAGLTPPH